MTDTRDPGPRSTPALISYISLGIFTATAGAIFAIIFTGIQVDALMAGILGTVLGATGGGFNDVRSFWLGSSSGAKSAQAEIAASGRYAQGALAQLAGSGPPPDTSGAPGPEAPS
jgi:hypothetical protein